MELNKLNEHMDYLLQGHPYVKTAIDVACWDILGKVCTLLGGRCPYSRGTPISLEAKHLILVWIMKVKGPKNQADFIAVLYVVVNAWGASF